MPEKSAATRAFGAECRLHRPQEFALVLQRGRRMTGKHFEVRCRDCGNGSARLGVIVPKRLARHAVMRNLLKRLARESFRAARASLPSADVVLRLTSLPDGDWPVGRDRRRAWRQEIDALLAGAGK